jgi:hypothetical protein
MVGIMIATHELNHDRWSLRARESDGIVGTPTESDLDRPAEGESSLDRDGVCADKLR